MWRARDLTLDFSDGRTHVMGILNVTPDSFSDGGKYIDPSLAIERAGEMIGQGATIIDVGGASSRPRGRVYGPGAGVLPAAEEIQRTRPVIEEVRRRWPEVCLSVDTYQLEVAAAALEAGAHIINDITALRTSPRIADLAAAANAGLILMHSVGVPGAMPHASESKHIVDDVKSDLRCAIDLARNVGVRSLIVDPGFGFGKTTRDNLRLIGQLDQLLDLGYPVVVGISRKSSIGAALRSESASDDRTPVPIEGRLYGSLGATAIAVLRGASIVRTHDVRETMEMLRVMNAIENTSTDSQKD